jgi:hypothetical protein
VVHHLHPGDILLHLVGLELILLPIGKEAVDGVLQPTLVAMDPRGDGMPGDVSHNIIALCSESWSLMSGGDSGPEEDLCDSFELHPAWTWDFLDLGGGGGDA